LHFPVEKILSHTICKKQAPEFKDKRSLAEGQTFVLPALYQSVVGLRNLLLYLWLKSFPGTLRDL
jgi:hypothetical protein